MGIPVIMVTGDTATCREARQFLGKDIVTVATKRGIGREVAELYSFEDTRTAIFEGAKKAVDTIANCKPYKIKMPIKCRIEWIEHSETPSETRVVVREATVKKITQIVDF